MFTNFIQIFMTHLVNHCNNEEGFEQINASCANRDTEIMFTFHVEIVEEKVKRMMNVNYQQSNSTASMQILHKINKADYFDKDV